MRLITVDVTQEDISNGRMGSCNFCPIALAIMRVTKLVPIVTGSMVGFVYGHESAKLPPEAVTFIRDFDARRSVQPFSFTLEIPD